MEEIDSSEGPTTFLNKICESVTGLKKIYITDMHGAILAESSLLSNELDSQIVRSFPTYFDRLGKISYGDPKSIVITSNNNAYLLMVSEGFLITFVCNPNANLALLNEFPDEMQDFLIQLNKFVE